MGFSRDGGGSVLYNYSNELSLLNLHFSNNSSTGVYHNDGSGGVIKNVGIIIDMRNLSFSNNSTSNSYRNSGGAICNTGTIINIDSSLFELNSVYNLSGNYAKGGAIYNSGIINNVLNSDFLYNTTNADYAEGGAIYNVGVIDKIYNSYFLENSANNGGAIRNDKNIEIIDTVTFENNIAKSGGAIYNNGQIKKIVNTIFEENSGNGILLNYGVVDLIGNTIFLNNSNAGLKNHGKIKIISYSTFINNINDYGAAIFNYAGDGIDVLDNILFEGNVATTDGGALSVQALIGEIKNSKFILNSANSGGAIWINELYGRNNGVINLIDNVIFEKNSAIDGSGGAISNSGTLSSSRFIGTISKSTFTGNSATKNGGAIFNYAVHSGSSATIDTISNSTFSANFANKGGAIYNYANSSGTSATIDTISNSTFVGNSAESGGAIYNGGYGSGTSIIDAISNSIFIGNTATSNGGAIHNIYGNIGYLDNVTFIGNSVTATATGENAEAYGGAIYNYGSSSLNILSSSGQTTFVGNSANGKSNAIHNANSTINLNAGDYNLSILDGISGSNGVLEINKSNVDVSSAQDASQIAPSHGTVILANEIDGNTVNFYDGKLILAHHTYTQEESSILAGQTGVANFANNSAFNIYGGHISTQDNAIYNHHLGNVTLYSDITMSIDANLDNKTMDTITFDTFNNPNNSIIDIQNISILKPTTDTDFTLSPFGNIEEAINSNLASSVKYTGGEIVYSPIYKYGVEYDNQTGLFNFKTTYTPQSPKYEDVNPAVLSTQTAAQSGSIANQISTFTEAFYHMDTFMTRDVNERIMMRDKNKYASFYQQGMLWDDAVSRRDNREAWYRPHVTIETVPLKNGPKVDNVSYGTYFGANSPVKSLKKGWDGAWGVFIGYNGSKQSYDSVDTRQNGATIGLVGELYKKNFFTGLSINAGASMGKADTMYGTDDFNTWVGGIASKTGYNFEFKNGRYIVQPTLLLGYSFIKTMDFTNSAGVKISSEPIHSVHIEPGVKVISPRKSGWRPYAYFSVIWNVLDKAKYKADGMPLPETSIKPYVKYGVGVQKNWTDRMTSFLQAHLTNGGRNGIGFQLGFSWLF